jgi:hypothetical protein
MTIAAVAVGVTALVGHGTNGNRAAIEASDVLAGGPNRA